MSHDFIETFPALSGLPGLVHGFILRDPEIDVKTDRETALSRLQEHYHQQLDELGIARSNLASGEQVHGNQIAICDGDKFPNDTHFPETDGLITGTLGQFVGVFVADCGAVFLADPVTKTCGIVHSGRKGTELQIAPRAIRMMQEKYRSNPEDIVVQLAPCVRPPVYDINFAADIVQNCIDAGVPESQVHDCGTCTSSDLDRYYSYRVEMGKTGRLYGVIGWKQDDI